MKIIHKEPHNKPDNIIIRLLSIISMHFHIKVFTWRVTARISSFFSLVISIPCLRASLSGPIDASFTKFFMSDPEYPSAKGTSHKHEIWKLKLNLSEESQKRLIYIWFNLRSVYHQLTCIWHSYHPRKA